MALDKLVKAQYTMPAPKPRLLWRLQVAPDGLCSYCKPCNAAAAAERRAKRPPVVAPTVQSKVCSHCQQVCHLTARDLTSEVLFRSTVRGDARDCRQQHPRSHNAPGELKCSLS